MTQAYARLHLILYDDGKVQVAGLGETQLLEPGSSHTLMSPSGAVLEIRVPEWSGDPQVVPVR